MSITNSNLTALEAIAIAAILKSEYDEDAIVGKCVWTFSVLDHSVGLIEKKQLGGILASLSNKQFLFVDNSVRGEECVTLLQAGYDAYLEFTKPVLACPNCLSENVSKNGKDTLGNQKIKCKDCKKGGTIKTIKDVPAKADTTEGATIMTQPTEELITNVEATNTEAVVETTEATTAPVEAPAEAPVEEAKPTKKPRKAAATKSVATNAAPATKKGRRHNDIYERGLYTVTRCMDESGLEGKELNKLKFDLQRALGKGDIKHEVEQLSGRQWRRVFTTEEAHRVLGEMVPNWKPTAPTVQS